MTNSRLARRPGYFSSCSTTKGTYGSRRGARRKASSAPRLEWNHYRRPYSIAANGGRHANFLEQAEELTDAQLTRADSSFQAQIEAHEAKIADPAGYAESWNEMSPQAQQGLINHWGKEINNFSDQRSIVQEILWRRGAVVMDPNYAAYVRDLVYLFREAAAEARKNKANATEPAYHEGRERAYIEVLLLMQSQADSFAIGRERLGLANFNPLTDKLEPPDPARNL